MFYSTSEPEIEEQKENISYIEQSALEWCNTCNNGCFLSVAYDIYNLLYGKARTKITDICLLDHSIKFSILDLLLDMADYECDKLLSDFNNNAVMNSNKHKNFQNHNSYGNMHFGKDIPGYLALFLERHSENVFGLILR